MYALVSMYTRFRSSTPVKRQCATLVRSHLTLVAHSIRIQVDTWGCLRMPALMLSLSPKAVDAKTPDFFANSITTTFHSILHEPRMSAYSV